MRQFKHCSTCKTSIGGLRPWSSRCRSFATILTRRRKLSSNQVVKKYLNNIFKKYFKVLNWLGSPFDIVLPLTDDDWELLRPVLRFINLILIKLNNLKRARFRCLVRNRPGGFEEIVNRAKKQDKSHYMVNKGFLIN